MRRFSMFLSGLLFSYCVSLSPAAANDADLFQALKSGGHVALIRHALAPGTGDPDEFDLAKCETQRNLSDEGRQQSKRMGDLFRAHGIDRASVYSSQWCRCSETARLMNIGPVTELPELNSLYRHPEKRESQTQALRDWVKAQPADAQLVLVTHQFTINAIVNKYTSSGEIVIARRGPEGLRVIGSVRTD